MRLDGYVRVSRVGARAGEGYISQDVQREAIGGYAGDLGGTIVAWHDDQDYSGGNVERPGFQHALERLRSGETDGLVVMKIDRFARSVADGATVVREIVAAGQVFASCHERIDPRTPEGKYMLFSFLANAELFLDQAKASWWTAKARAVARGVHIGPTPVGYRRERSKPLTVDPTYGPAVAELFKRCASGELGDSALARWMTERSPRKGGAPWQSSEVRRWLSNRLYLGEVRYGDLGHTEAHEPLTDPDTWERCQREPGKQRKGHSRFLLSGLVRCARCRYGMGGQRHGGAQGQTPVYRCNGGRHGCEESSVITADRLDGFMRQLVFDRLRGLGLELEAAEDGLDLESRDREYREAEAELQAFAADLNARQVLGEAGWQGGLAARATDRDAKREARDRDYTESRLVTVARNVEELDQGGLRDLLDGMVRHIFVRRRSRGAEVTDRVLVIWSDDPRAVEAPGPHRPGPFEPVRW